MLLAGYSELQGLLDQYADVLTPDGRKAVVRNGHLPKRTIQTGVGDVDVGCYADLLRLLQELVSALSVLPLFAGADQCCHHLTNRWRGFELVSTGADGDVKPGYIGAVVDRNPVITHIPEVGYT